MDPLYGDYRGEKGSSLHDAVSSAVSWHFSEPVQTLGCLTLADASVGPMEEQDMRGDGGCVCGRVLITLISYARQPTSLEPDDDDDDDGGEGGGGSEGWTQDTVSWQPLSTPIRSISTLLVMTDYARLFPLFMAQASR